ncbi:MAG: SRPBCC family protein [Spirochaetia bacterium]
MNTKHVARAAISIQTGIEKVWNALTNPALVKQYLYGTEVHSDWRKGNPITYKGVWQGKAYEDKGVIVEIVPPQRLVSTYWSSMSGLPDTPENYNTVSYELSYSNGATTLQVTQDNNATKESADHSASNWAAVLRTLKSLMEK